MEIKYNKQNKFLTGETGMGSYLNPGDFSVWGSGRSERWINKSGLIAKANEVLCKSAEKIW